MDNTFDAPTPQKESWHFEYYCGFPNIRFTFQVTANTREEAEREADKAVRSLRRTACYNTRYR